jgi:hypothetical protein
MASGQGTARADVARADCPRAVVEHWRKAQSQQRVRRLAGPLRGDLAA